MALTADALTTLADVKAVAGITDTTQDTRLEYLINAVSAQIAGYCDRVFTRSTYTLETHTGTNRQSLSLRQWPIVSVSSILEDGTTLPVTEYELKAQDMERGIVYKANGWNQNTTYATGLTSDTWATGRDYSATYVAGYYMPGDVTSPPADPHYVAGAAGSLPLELSEACVQMVIERNTKLRYGAIGLTQLTEGDLTYQWGAITTNIDTVSGLPNAVLGIVNKYKRRFVA